MLHGGLENVRLLASFLVAGLAATAAHATSVVLTFEGLQDQEAVENFYNGGTGSLGSSGTNYGINFASNGLAIIRNNAGGNGNFGDEPSQSTALFFLNGGAATMNVAAGFDTGFSFYYSAVYSGGTVTVWDAAGGAAGGGNLLASLTLPTTPDGATSGCTDNPGANFCPFLPFGVAFSGTAYSVDFGGTENQIAFDNITLGAAVPISGTPEPATFALLGGAALLAGGLKLRRRKA